MHWYTDPILGLCFFCLSALSERIRSRKHEWHHWNYTRWNTVISTSVESHTHRLLSCTLSLYLCLSVLMTDTHCYKHKGYRRLRVSDTHTATAHGGASFQEEFHQRVTFCTVESWENADRSRDALVCIFVIELRRMYTAMDRPCSCWLFLLLYYPSSPIFNKKNKIWFKDQKLKFHK